MVTLAGDVIFDRDRRIEIGVVATWKGEGL